MAVLPGEYASEECNRLSILFFSLSGLDILNGHESSNKNSIIEWIYALKTKSPSSLYYGFAGSTCTRLSNVEASDNLSNYDESHVAMTYVGLASLIICGDNLAKLSRPEIAASLKALQQPDGSFIASFCESISDMRFVYCASCVSYIIQDWSGMNIEKAIKFIQNSLTYEGAFGQSPGLEAHGGSTFCAVASLVLMGKLDDALTKKQKDTLVRWCLMRQISGFQGRPNKAVDTCYSFWVVATLKLLGADIFVDRKSNREFLLATQDGIKGGFGKWIDSGSDLLHTYFGIAGLAALNEFDLEPTNVALNITQRSFEHLRTIHEKWKKCA